MYCPMILRSLVGTLIVSDGFCWLCALAPKQPGIITAFNDIFTRRVKFLLGRFIETMRIATSNLPLSAPPNRDPCLRSPFQHDALIIYNITVCRPRRQLRMSIRGSA
ncbi:hypothetical protein F5141DRAFT_825077 [Pisolithus sp. B1]|nr:hypothetical protein F5141DRAFT_825077 [Pisolithus sp. B1]